MALRICRPLSFRHHLLARVIRSINEIRFPYRCMYFIPQKRPSVMNNPNYRLASVRFSSLPSHNVVKLPNLSPTMETGTVVSWAKNEGDEVNEGDLLAEIETDKATMSFDASDAGYLAKILAPAGTKDIPVGTPLCVIVEDSSFVAAFKDFAASGSDVPPASAPPKAATPPSSAPAPSAAAPVPAAAPAPSADPSSAATAVSPIPTVTPQRPAPITTGERVFVSPLARRIAAEKGIDINQLGTGTQGTGIHGMFRASDVISFQPSARSVGVSGGFSDAHLVELRSVVAQRSLESQLTVPHYYLTVDIAVDEALKLRDNVNKTLEKRAGKVPENQLPKISLNDILIKAVAATCSKVPECNSSWQGSFIRQYHTVDVNVTIPTPEGLVMPVVTNAESKGLLQINQDVDALTVKAQENKLSPQDNQTGTFTISNLGMFGISSFNTFINTPQACLLAVGAVQKQVSADSTAPKGFKLEQVISVTLCCDHRIVDGSVGATWLSEFKLILENPDLMLI